MKALTRDTENLFSTWQVNPSLPIAPQAYEFLRQCIVDNTLPPGAPISEGIFAAQLKISRTPLRTAMQQLAGEGLIVTRPQVGSVVAMLDTERLEEAVFMRSVLEEAVVRRLAERGLDRQVLAKSFAVQKLAADADDYATFFQEDEQFHAKLAVLAGVPNTWRLVHSVKGHVDRQRFRMMSGIPYRSMRAYRDHLKIVRRIAAGDGDGAALEMRKHVHSVLELVPDNGTLLQLQAQLPADDG